MVGQTGILALGLLEGCAENATRLETDLVKL